MNKMRIYLYVLGFVIGHLLLYLLLVFVAGREFAIRYLSEILIAVVLVDLVLVVTSYVHIAYHQISEEIYNDQESNKRKLETEVDQLKNSTLNYDGLTLEKDLDEAYIGQYMSVGAKLSPEIKLWAIVHNADQPVYDCAVELENLEYNGRYSNGRWVNSPSDFDRKALKWDVGYVPNNGKIDISARTRKKLELAVACPQPQAKMELSHLDGYSNRRHRLDGTYRATVRIDGKVFIKQVRNEIKPRWYEVEFEYYNSSTVLRLLEIKEYEPPQEAI